MTLHSSTLMHSILGQDIFLSLFLHLSPPLELISSNSSILILEKNIKERIAQRISHPKQFGLTHGERDAITRV